MTDNIEILLRYEDLCVRVKKEIAEFQARKGHRAQEVLLPYEDLTIIRDYCRTYKPHQTIDAHIEGLFILDGIPMRGIEIK